MIKFDDNSYFYRIFCVFVFKVEINIIVVLLFHLILLMIVIRVPLDHNISEDY